MKVGLIRCLQTEDMCAAGTCLHVIKNKKMAFEAIEGDVAIAAVNTCGGCPGKKAVTRAALMLKQGADAIALSSCITKGSPVGISCPHKEAMAAAIRKRVGEDVTIVNYTHD